MACINDWIQLCFRVSNSCLTLEQIDFIVLTRHVHVVQSQTFILKKWINETREARAFNVNLNDGHSQCWKGYTDVSVRNYTVLKVFTFKLKERWHTETCFFL